MIRTQDFWTLILVWKQLFLTLSLTLTVSENKWRIILIVPQLHGNSTVNQNWSCVVTRSLDVETLVPICAPHCTSISLVCYFSYFVHSLYCRCHQGGAVCQFAWGWYHALCGLSLGPQAVHGHPRVCHGAAEGRGFPLLRSRVWGYEERRCLSQDALRQWHCDRNIDQVCHQFPFFSILKNIQSCLVYPDYLKNFIFSKLIRIF